MKALYAKNLNCFVVVTIACSLSLPRESPELLPLENRNWLYKRAPSHKTMFLNSSVDTKQPFEHGNFVKCLTHGSTGILYQKTWNDTVDKHIILRPTLYSKQTKQKLWILHYCKTIEIRQSDKFDEIFSANDKQHSEKSGREPVLWVVGKPTWVSSNLLLEWASYTQKHPPFWNHKCLIIWIFKTRHS